MAGLESLRAVLGQSLTASDEEEEDEIFNKEDSSRRPRGSRLTASSDEPPIDLRYPQRGFSRYFPALANFSPFRSSRRPEGIARIDQVGCFSFITYSWLFPFLWSAFRGSVSRDRKLWGCSTYDSAAVNMKRLQHLWQEEIQKKTSVNQNPSLCWTMVRFVSTRMLIGCLIFMICLGFGFIGPTCLVKSLIAYVETSPVCSSKNFILGLTLVVSLLLVEFFRVLSYGASWAVSYRTGIRARSSVLSILFFKLLRSRSLGDKNIGEVVNIYTNDGQRIFDAVTFAPLVITGSFVLVGGLVYLWVMIGAWSLMGLLVYFIFNGLQAFIGRSIVKYRNLSIQKTEARIGLMTEVICCMKLIKACAWERSFTNRINKIRESERKFLAKAGLGQSLAIGLGTAVPVAATVVTFMAHIGAQQDLLASQAFSIITVFFVMVFGIRMIPYGMRYCGEAMVSLLNIQSYLLTDEVELQHTAPMNKTLAIAFQEANLSWNNSSEAAPSEAAPLAVSILSTGGCLNNISLSVEKKQLIGICGPVGCGKSSLLQSLIGQMAQNSGSLYVSGKLAYCAQDPWILSGTIRDNILFGDEMHSHRYYKVLYSCGLNADINALAAGDETEVGERGVTLSGGQKLRISLARAIYSSRCIYLLDCPLVGLDQHVAAHVFTYAIKGLLVSKTVLLVTNDVQFLSQCNEVVFMQEGRITAKGFHEDLLSSCQEYVSFVTQARASFSNQQRPESVLLRELSDPEEAPESLTKDPNDFAADVEHLKRRRKRESAASRESLNKVTLGPSDSLFDIPSGGTDGQLLESEEDFGISGVACNVYKAYFSAAGGSCTLFLVISLFLVNTASIIFCTVWLRTWLNNVHVLNSTSSIAHENIGNSNQTCIEANFTSGSLASDPNMSWYMSIYGLSLVVVFVVTVVKSWLFVQVSLKASSNMHSSMLDRIMRAPLTFFDRTPMGRIINRFSKDMDELDTKMPFSIESFLQNLLTMLAYLLIIAWVFPWFLAAVIPLGILFWFLVACFRSGIRYLKRLENNSRSPLLAHVETSLRGLSTIHAFEQQGSFHERLKLLLDENSDAMYMFQSAMRWLAVWLDMLVVTITFATSLFIVLHGNGTLEPADAGMALVFAMQMSGIFQFAVRMYAEMESKMTSVERIEYYVKNVEQEPAWQLQPPPIDWPSEGRISFRDVKVRYRDNCPWALKGVSFDIKPKEKVGIIGRTGSGKSTIAAALFRLVEANSGSIAIDGVDITSFGLHDARRRMALIPQEPLLFAGSLRFNLDPNGQYNDDQLWQALDAINFKSFVQNRMDKQLDTMISESGRNLSVGERQLICMARALLRNVKILVLDEATANIDPLTDSLIQICLEEMFSNCTVLIIAHKLKNIEHCDRIIFVDNGKIIENDKPSVLISDPSSRFYQLSKAALVTTAEESNN